jgi:GNAT superfamily N-acetyltransferase
MSIEVHVGTIDDVLAVDTKIPEFDGRTTFNKIVGKLSGKASLILIASHNQLPIAYKVGYAVSKTEFYSWLGGVAPDYRKQGIATQLRQQQEAWALTHGYKAISVKSMNRYPAMLQMLISSGYQITGYEENGAIDTSKIKFFKDLK